MSGLPLEAVVATLERFASTKYAGIWDNVGLLIEPHTKRTIKTIFLTNDLTETILLEAVKENTDLIISYHPPIFASLKRITQSSWKQKIVSMCLEKRIALYSPHTAWDFVKGGVNDWLSNAFPIVSTMPIQKPFADLDGGIGRKVEITPLAIRDVIQKVKTHVGTQVHVGVAANKTLDDLVMSVAVCAGSGSSVLNGVHADVYLTGEMAHHDILDATQNGTTIILCNHTNSERGFLKYFQIILKKELQEQCTVIVSKLDADPLITY